MKNINLRSGLLHILVFLYNAPLLALGSYSLDDIEVSFGSTLDLVSVSKTNIAFTPPVVNSPVYYCQGSAAVPLTATASPGNTFFYVSETDGVAESARVQIVVNVVADNGSKILLLRCDPS